MKEPRPYQVACWEAIRDAVSRGVRRQLCSLWPGLGKTFAGARLRAQLGVNRMLVLAHRRELLTQWRDEIQEADPEASIGIEMGDVREADCDTDIVLGSVPTLCKPWRRHKLYNPYDIIQIDECDLALARTWLETIKAFGVGEDNGPLLIGWTGTPYRHDGQELANLFDEVVFDLGLKAPPGGRSAIDMGYLCPAKAKRVRSAVSIADVPVFGGDFSQERLLEAVDVPERNDLIVTAIEEHAQDRDSILVFVTGVEQAKRLADTLRLRGHHAESVDGKTTPGDRAGILRRFGETGETRILVNVDILTRGTNIPRIDAIVEGHPTHSATRYIQGMSRGFRLSPETGKRDLLVIDIVDVCGKHPVQTAAAVFGLRSIDALGQDLRIVQKVSETAEQLGIEVQDGDTVIEIVKKIGMVERVARQAMRVDTTAEAIDLFSATRLPGIVEQGSEFPWVQVKDAYCLMIDRDHRAILKRDECGIWGCAVNNGRPLGGLKIGQSPKPPFREADKIVKRFAGAWTTKDGFKVHRWKSISRKSKKWSMPPTPQQREALGRHGIRALPPGISSGAAYAMLSAIVLRRELR